MQMLFVMLLAIPLDTDWSTLPAKNDFLPFLHEMVFVMLSKSTGRNVDIGSTLTLKLKPGEKPEEIEFRLPDNSVVSGEPLGDEEPPRVRLSNTPLPGIYRATRKSNPMAPAEAFVAEFDRSESDLTPLDAETKTALSKADRVKFTESVSEVQVASAVEAPRTELWRLLMFAVLGLLVFETAMTRRLVQGGHETVDLDGLA